MERFESRIAKLERIFALQQALIDKLSLATFGHQKVITALAQLAGVELEQQPAPPAPATN
jgi:uncharacterized coiled-coil protein SlyX